MRNQILKSYKDLLRYGETLRFTDKKYYRYRIRQTFRANTGLVDENEITFQFNKGLKLLEKQRVV